VSEYESLREDIAGLGEAVERAMEAQNRLTDAHGTEIERLWADNTALREDVHAVANRLEALTRAITTSPAEVAAAIVNDANRSTLRQVDFPPRFQRSNPESQS
jgi:hypothetical protein